MSSTTAGGIGVHIRFRLSGRVKTARGEVGDGFEKDVEDFVAVF